MKQLIKKNPLTKFFAFALLSLFTFQAKAGGDSYQIYLNNKLILKQYVTQPLNIKSLELDKANANDRLVIFYSHCGQIGKERSIIIKDDNEKILKEWKFADVTGRDAGMVIPVKELLQIKSNNNKRHLSLYYYAQQLPQGRKLYSVNAGNHSITMYHSQGMYWFAGAIILSIFGAGKFYAARSV